jgi:hypothetical protein
MPAADRTRPRPRLRLTMILAALLALPAALLLAAATPAHGMTLVRCKVDGKTVYSDTDCPRSTRLKNDLPASKPIRIKRSKARRAGKAA